jgi:hypothetical protein
MSKHRFEVGDILDLQGARAATQGAADRCEIRRLLATDGDDPQYRVKCQAESFERVVRESQLSADGGPKQN